MRPKELKCLVTGANRSTRLVTKLTGKGVSDIAPDWLIENTPKTLGPYFYHFSQFLGNAASHRGGGQRVRVLRRPQDRQVPVDQAGDVTSRRKDSRELEQRDGPSSG